MKLSQLLNHFWW